jgi:hypothetical protein
MPVIAIEKLVNDGGHYRGRASRRRRAPPTRWRTSTLATETSAELAGDVARRVILLSKDCKHVKQALCYVGLEVNRIGRNDQQETSGIARDRLDVAQPLQGEALHRGVHPFCLTPGKCAERRGRSVRPPNVLRGHVGLRATLAPLGDLSAHVGAGHPLVERAGFFHSATLLLCQWPPDRCALERLVDGIGLGDGLPLSGCTGHGPSLPGRRAPRKGRVLLAELVAGVDSARTCTTLLTAAIAFGADEQLGQLENLDAGDWKKERAG